MDFIKKHIEKLVLALVLLTLIVVAALLVFKVNSLNQLVTGAAWRPKPTGKLVQPIDMVRYTNAIASLQSPSLWHTNAINPFQEVIPPPTNIVVVVDTNTNVVVETFILTSITRKPFKLMFKAYIGKGESFQVELLSHRRSFFVAKVGDKIADRFGDTGFVVTKFMPKEEIVEIPGVGKRQQDVSELTIQSGDQPPIVLILNKVTEEKEPEARVTCVADNKALALRKEQTFACGGKTYKVVDIASTQVIIVDEVTQEKHTIGLSGAKE